jgi:hypothetical protein
MAQKPARQWTPLAGVPQQSLSTVHFSSTFEQAGGGEMHVNAATPLSVTTAVPPSSVVT